MRRRMLMGQKSLAARLKQKRSVPVSASMSIRLNVGLIERLLKWKARLAIWSGLFTLVIIPVARWIIKMLKRRGPKAKTSKIIDAEFEEIK